MASTAAGLSEAVLYDTLVNYLVSMAPHRRRGHESRASTR